MGNSSIVELLEAYPIPEEKEIPPYKIYCDMDGVLTDFQKRFEHFTGMSPKEYENKYGTAGFWNLIDVEVGIKFWSDMDWMPEGRRLWSFIEKYNPELLTSPSKDNGSRLGKNLWVRENLTPLPNVIFSYSKDKQRYANSNSILIDDKKSNINEWIARGGIALRCKNGNITPVIESLIKLGYE
jgi:hypothetical protein